MSDPISMRLRRFGGSLLIISGFALIASLWMRTLNEVALLDALLGVTYINIAIGLFGHSRFSLFIAALVTGAMAIYLYRSANLEDPFYQVRIAVDALVALLCTYIFWRLRHNSSP